LTEAGLPRWRAVAAHLLALIPAVVLILAAFLKAGDPGLFAEQITAHRVTPASWSPFLAYAFVAGELALAAALLAFVRPRVVFGLTILLMLGFIGVTAWAWAHGNAESCGCFGRLGDRGPGEVIRDDAILIVLSAAGLWLARGVRTRRRQWVALGVLLVPVITLTVFGSSLPLDGVVVGIRPGTSLADLALEGPAPALEEGSVLLVLIGPDCPACEAGVPALKQLAGSAGAPKVLAAFSGAPSAAQVWRLKHLPNFPVAAASPRVLRQYYRRLPATFRLENGIVRQVWWNRIPAAEEVRAR
jgi:thiol-disulfide isomerase/thioredoxin